MADDAVTSAQAELCAGRLHFAINRAYYAAFYAATALLLAEGHAYSKHTAVQAAVHRDLVHTGRLEEEHGATYSRLMEEREHGDYDELASFEPDLAAKLVTASANFVDRLRQLHKQSD
jgi:hypothetical protein